MFQVCISFDPEGPQYTDTFENMEEAFAAYTEATEGLPARVGVFCFKRDGEAWEPLLKRVNSAYRKRIKALAGDGESEGEEETN